MSELKYFDPQPETQVFYSHPQYRRQLSERDFHDLRDKRVKWTRRHGSSVSACLDTGYRKRGIMLTFPNTHQYEQAIKRVFRALTTSTDSEQN